jgi:putative salt-induced outer membrane protein YdiY
MLPFTSLLLASTLCAEPTPAPVEIADLVEPARPGFDLSANLSAASPDDVKPEEYGKWHGSVTFGATSASGNTDRFTAALGANAVNRREKDRRTFDLLWNYAEEEGTITQRRTYASGKYDYFVDKKLYYLGQASLENDMNAKLDLRAIAGAGAGYQFREDDIWKLAGEAGLSYVDENYDGSSDDAEFIAARLAYKADWTPNKAWAVGQATQLYPSLEDNDDITARVDTHAKVTLTEKMFAQLQWIYSWDNTPATGAERVDNLFLLMIGWTF